VVAPNGQSPDVQEDWLVVGLGNPGGGYDGTRHNVGFEIVDELARRSSGVWRQKWGAALWEGTIGGRRARLAKPQTYMNLSGQAVGEIARYFHIAAERIVVAHDEVDIEPGRLKVKFGGGDAGHKGVKSVTEALGTSEFARVRVGVGKRAGHDTADWVLAPISRAERDVMSAAVTQAADAVETIMRHGHATAMNKYNVRPATVGDDESGT
jgi:peptidyl-tRNA hydrolase, PTH1 family